MSNDLIAKDLPFNLFARFATSELTHSGIWAWILQSLDEACPPEYQELRAPAQALLNRIGVAPLEGRIRVRREQPLPGGGGRVDIEVRDGRDRVVVLETKVKARPDVAQRLRYEMAYRSEKGSLAGIAILSTTFDEPWNDVGARHVGASDLLEILQAGAYQLDIMRQYVEWLDHELTTRERLFTQVLSDDTVASSKALGSASAQWRFMRALGDAIGGPSAASLYCGTNGGVSRWTQLAFSEGSADARFDALFYRLDGWDEWPALFTVRQYQKKIEGDKRERLRLLRGLFDEAIAEAGVPTEIFVTNPKGARLGASEAQVARAVLEGAVSARVLLEHLPRVHAAFVRRLVDEGWPLLGMTTACASAAAEA